MNPSTRPFPIPIVAVGPGSQPDEDDGLTYPVMPRGMSTWQGASLPEPEDARSRPEAVAALRAVLAALHEAVRGGDPAPVDLSKLDATQLALVNQVLGEGEVAAQVLPPGQSALPSALGTQAMRLAPPGLAAGVAVQESVFAGVWRVVRHDGDGARHDVVEIGAIPRVLAQAAQADAFEPTAAMTAPAEARINVPALLTELADQRRRWHAGQPSHVVNLTLLPLEDADIAALDMALGTGRVVILSRGYGNCRITNCLAPHTWRVVYFNSSDTVILNAVEVGAVPEVACAAPQDLADSAERLAEVLDWVGRDV